MLFRIRENYPYEFIEWVNLDYLRLRGSRLFRLRYAYFYVLLVYVCSHRLYLLTEKSVEPVMQVFHYDYARMLFRVPTRYVIWLSVDFSMFDSFNRYVFSVPIEIVHTFLNIFVNRKQYPIQIPIQYFPYENYKRSCLTCYHWVMYSFAAVFVVELLALPFALWKALPVLIGVPLEQAMLLLTTFSLNAYAFYHVGALMAFVTTSGATFAMLFILMMNIILRNMHSSIQRRTNGRKLLKWRRHYIEIMLFLFRLNKMQGPSLTSVIICGTPPHAYLTVYVFSHPNMRLTELVNNIVALAIISTYIFGCHMAVSKFCDSVSKPAKYIYSHISRGYIKQSIKQRLILSHLLLNIHSKHNSYGYTYGSHGLICHKSFIEFVWLYVGFILYAYKWIVY